MAQATLRFAHASNLRFDSPVYGVGRLSGEQQNIVEDAQASAWERVVETCIDRDVAFLLLTPRTSERDWSLIDRRLLRDGFRQLEEFGIRVYWARDEREPIGADSHEAWPDNVTLLTRAGETATLIQHGTAIAALLFGESESGEHRIAGTSATDVPIVSPLRILIPAEPRAAEQPPADGISESAAHGQSRFAEWDYVAAWGSPRTHTRRLQSTVCSDPGSPQPRSAGEAVGGVNIVEWDGRAISDIQRVETGVVRWQRCMIGITAEMSPEEFAERMQLALLEREPSHQEKLLIAEWHVVGSGPLLDALKSEATRRKLEEGAQTISGGHRGSAWTSCWNVRTRWDGLGDSVGVPMVEWLSQQGEAALPLIVSELQAELQRRDLPVAADCLPLVSASGIRDAAEQRLGEWLADERRKAV